MRFEANCHGCRKELSDNEAVHEVVKIFLYCSDCVKQIIWINDEADAT